LNQAEYQEAGSHWTCCASVFVAHNAPFDLRALAAELEICRLSLIDDFVIDTLALTRLCYFVPQQLTERCGIPGDGHKRSTPCPLVWRPPPCCHA